MKVMEVVAHRLQQASNKKHPFLPGSRRSKPNALPEPERKHEGGGSSSEADISWCDAAPRLPCPRGSAAS